MKAILLAAGLGTRLRPITIITPKCLVDINGKPLLEYWLDNLFSAGIEKIFINTHYLSDKVHDYLNSYKLRFKIIISHEASLLGTGGTLVSAIDFIGNDESFFVIHADNYSKFNIQDMMDIHAKRDDGIEITMMCFKTDRPESCGILKIENNRVIDFYEKIRNPPGNIANGAVYIFSRKIIKYIYKNKEQIHDISNDLIPKFLGKIQVFENNTYHRDIGDLNSLRLARNGL
jgi:mannose-1-phosphate guanylyltransferase